MYKGRNIGAALVSDYTGDDCEITVLATGHVFDQETIRFIARYVFETLGCKRCTATIGPDKPGLSARLERLGLTLEHTYRVTGRQMYSITKEEWKDGQFS